MRWLMLLGVLVVGLVVGFVGVLFVGRSRPIYTYVDVEGPDDKDDVNGACS